MIFDYKNSQCLNRSKNEDLATPNLYERAQKVPTKSYRESLRKLSEKSRPKSRISDNQLLTGMVTPSMGHLEDFLLIHSPLYPIFSNFGLLITLPNHL